MHSSHLKIKSLMLIKTVKKCNACECMWEETNTITYPTGDKNEVALHDWPCYIIAGLVSFRTREWHAPASDVFRLKPIGIVNPWFIADREKKRKYCQVFHAREDD